MDFVKQQWTQVRAGLGQLSAQSMAMIGLLVALMLAILIGWMAWAGNSNTRTLPFAGGNAEIVVATLRQHGIDAEVDNGQVKIPSSEQYDAVAVLLQNDLMTADPSDVWSELVSKQSPWETRAQAEVRIRKTTQDYAGRVISSMKGVRSAKVFIAPKPQMTFGQPYTRRTASVNVTMEGKRRLDQSLVEAVAAFVAGGDGEMKPIDVTVIDANHGIAHKVDDPDDVIPTETIELVANLEKQYKEKILELLAINGLRVAVNVQIDSIHKQQKREIEYEKTPPPTSEATETITRRDIKDSGAPGVRSNTGASIEGGSQSGMEETIETAQTDFGVNKVVAEMDTVFTGHQKKQINVSISVPRQYFVTIYKARNPDAEGEPDTATLMPIIEEKIGDIESRVEPIIETTGPGRVVAAMYEDASSIQIAGDPTAVGINAVLTGPMAQPILVGAMVLGVMGMIVFMVRKATRPESLPSVEELAGLPPRLQSDEDLVGEVEETQSTMSGVELDENELESRKIAEQISDLIKSNPDEVGSLLGKWVKEDD